MWIDAHAHVDRFDLVGPEAARAALEEIREHRILTIIGKPGTPLLIREVVQGLAGLRGTSPEQIERTVEANLRRLVRDDPCLAEARKGWGW